MVDGPLRAVAEAIKSKLLEARKSYLNKVLSAVFPSKTDKKPQTVVKETRGRPTKKVQEQKEDESRHSTFESARHSSYTPLISNRRTPPLQRSLSTSSRGKQQVLSEDQSEQWPNAKPEAVNNLERFGKYVPKLFHDYITRFQDVRPDGSCGFRTVVVGLEMHENRWSHIRKQLLLELTTQAEKYKYVFNMIDNATYDNVKYRLDYFDIAPAGRWMIMPYTGLIVAQRFARTVHFFRDRGCATFFSLWIRPEEIREHKTLSIVHVPDHFVRVELGGRYPFPTVSSIWQRGRNDVATVWETVYKDQIMEYQVYTDANKKVAFRGI